MEPSLRAAGPDVRDATQPATHWPSQTEVADAAHVNPPRVYQTLAADRSVGAKTRSITAFRHELCEQICRLGGVVTMSRTHRPDHPVASSQPHARHSPPTTAGLGGRTGGSRNRRHDGATSVPTAPGRRQDRRRLLAGTGGLCRQARPGCRRPGGERSAAAAAASLQELYEVAQPPLPPGPVASPSATNGS